MSINYAFRHGFYGTVLLPTIGILSALIIGEFWAAIILALVITLEKPLIAWLRSGSEFANASHAPFVRQLDKASIYFTALVLIIASVVWFINGDFERFVEVIATASLAPLLITAPLVLATGLQKVRGLEVYVRSVAILEVLARIQSVVISKTGIMTTSNPTLAKVTALSGHTKHDVLQIASALACQSNHPLAVAIIQSSQSDFKVNKAKHANEVADMGMSGRMRGQTMHIGRLMFLEQEGVNVPYSLNNISNTAVFVAKNHDIIGYIEFNETLRPFAKQMVKKLLSLGIKDVVLVSNDMQKPTATIAEAAGMTSFHADSTHSSKISIVENIKHKPVLFVGDEDQDTAALTAADVSMIFGKLRTTLPDIAIHDENLYTLTTVINTALSTLKRAKLFSIISLFIALVLVMIAAAGIMSPVQAAGAQLILLVLVVTTASYGHLKTIK